MDTRILRSTYLCIVSTHLTMQSQYKRRREKILTPSTSNRSETSLVRQFRLHVPYLADTDTSSLMRKKTVKAQRRKLRDRFTLYYLRGEKIHKWRHPILPFCVNLTHFMPDPNKNLLLSKYWFFVPIWRNLWLAPKSWLTLQTFS